MTEKERIAKKVAQTIILDALDKALEEVQSNVVSSETDSERELWVGCRKEIQTLQTIASSPSVKSNDECEFSWDRVSRRRKAVLELWNRGGLTQQEIANYLNESAYNVRQDLTTFRKNGAFVRKAGQKPPKL